jgi:hypothetical protein
MKKLLPFLLALFLLTSCNKDPIETTYHSWSTCPPPSLPEYILSYGQTLMEKYLDATATSNADTLILEYRIKEEIPFFNAEMYKPMIEIFFLPAIHWTVLRPIHNVYYDPLRTKIIVHSGNRVAKYYAEMTSTNTSFEYKLRILYI